MKNQQIGAGLLEVWIALLILSQVVFGLVAMQLFSAKHLRQNDADLVATLQQANTYERALAEGHDNA